MIDTNCINMAAVRMGERVTITVVSNGTGKHSITVDSDSVAYSMFLELADHVSCDSPLSAAT